MKAWRKKFNAFFGKSYPTEKYFGNFQKTSPKKMLPLEKTGFEDMVVDFPPRTLDIDIVNRYSEQRDIPSIRGTSRLSLHLRFGTVSIRELVRKAWAHEKWINELIWREFYMMILWHFPHVVDKSFKPQYDRLVWLNNEELFNRWCEGNTGYPIVDAGMRELNSTGFMHNRVRMITAMFLSKYLLIDWRWGEAYFAEKLLDYELASNNGGWQWSASTGVDAAPYFRLFNMDEQTKRFDPDFLYIKKWVPEFQELTYAKPIVDYKFARERCLAFYKAG
jgi:deoxyribodipyrimidine photo-lyase